MSSKTLEEITIAIAKSVFIGVSYDISKLVRNPTLCSYAMTMTFPTVFMERYKMRLLIATVASTSALAITVVQGHVGRRPAMRPCAGAMTGHFRVQHRLLPPIQRTWIVMSINILFSTLHHDLLLLFLFKPDKAKRLFINGDYLNAIY